jgi:hypothetical protein
MVRGDTNHGKKNFGDSKMAKMKGVDEKSDLKNIKTNLTDLDGHFVENALEIGEIPSGSKGAIEKRKDKKKP